MIPKHIFSIWLNENPELPPLVKKCVESHQIPGYTYELITLDNYKKWSLDFSEYVRDAIANKRWVKASDYMRCEYMWKMGGIHLDGDMEVLPGKNFDDLLDCRMFTSYEVCGLYANAGFGAEAYHPLLKAYMDRVDQNYKGTGDLVFEPGIRTFHDIFWAADKSLFKMIGTDVFFPYNHVTGEIKLTPNSKVYHHYNKSWQK